MPIPQLIDVDLWDKARWRGVAFGYDPSALPFMALVFTDGAAAEQIFRGMIDAVGENDPRALIRVALIEGDIPGKDPGYSVHVGLDHAAAIAAARSNGEPMADVITGFTRIHRMPTPRAVHLAAFRREFQKQKRYELLPGVLSQSGKLLFSPSLKITKKEIVFRRAADIGLNDIDSVVVAREKNIGRVH